MNSFRLQSTHVLVDCADSKEGWMEAGLADVIQCRLQNFQSTQEVIFYICSKEETEVAERVAVMAWIIWNSWELKQSICGATLARSEWFVVQGLQRELRDQTEQVQHTPQWQSTRHGWLKCNVDVSFHAACGQ
jgi:hypothetical protein